MWTIMYKGHYIHGYCHKDECYFDNGKEILHVKSLHAAKCIITRNSRK